MFDEISKYIRDDIIVLKKIFLEKWFISKIFKR